jgi:hypothetical protein
MALLSTKINDLCLKDGDATLKESLMRSVPVAQRKLPENVLNSKERNESVSEDVVLLCGPNQHQILANRAALASKVPSLIEMIESNNNEARILLPDVEPDVVQALMNFVYTSKLDLTADKVLDVLSAAEKLEINEILNTCQEYIQQNVLSDSWLFARQIALDRSSKWLLTAVDNYIHENFSALLQSTDFLELPRLQVEIINKKEDIRSETEICNEILGLVVDWCKVKLEVCYCFIMKSSRHFNNFPPHNYFDTIVAANHPKEGQYFQIELKYIPKKH